MRRYILTGAPGSGKTTILRALESRGVEVVDEAATAVIAVEQAAGVGEPWASPDFIEKITRMQQRRRAEVTRRGSGVQLFDRSPVCTLALCAYLGHPVPAVLSDELDRIGRGELYDRRVFFVRDLGFVEPTAARTISFAESLEFEDVHARTYRGLGYQLVDVPRAAVAVRADQIEGHLVAWA